MACDTYTRQGQTIEQRKTEIRDVVARLSAKIINGTVKVVVGPQGAVTFDGWTADRNGITDACALRRIMATGSPLAKAKIAAAEQMAGRGINKQAIAQGHHSHDGGKTWHRH